MIVRVSTHAYAELLSRVVVDSLGWVGWHVALLLPLELIPSVLVNH